MRKKISILLFALIGILLFPNIVNADLLCEGISYGIYRDNNGLGYPLYLNQNVEYGMYVYGVSGYSNVKAYCIDPMKRSGVGTAGCVRRIDPSNVGEYQAYDVAVTKAYQMLVSEGRNTTSMEDRVLGEVIFRWLGNRFGMMRGYMNQTHNNVIGGGTLVTKGEEMSTIFNPNSYGSHWVGHYADADLAYRIYSAAEAAGSRISGGASYQDLIDDGTLAGEKYTYTATQETTATNTEEIHVTLTLENPGEVVVDWSGFTGGCDNTGVVCTSAIINQSGNTIDILITVTKQPGYDGQDYEVYVQTSAYAEFLSTSNMIIVRPSSDRQNMLLVNDVQSGSGFLQGGTKVYIETTPGPPDNNRHVCEIIGDQHYCNDGEPCSEPEYREDCLKEINCTPTITMPSDCNNFDVESNATGIISDINEVASSCNPDVDQVTQCVLGHNDLTDTSFESTLELVDNPYCKVYCKESYEFNMPTAKITRSGGYFTLSTTINAERDCYVASNDGTSSGINTSQFQEDLTVASHAVVDAYNQYKYYTDASAEGVKSVHEEADDTCGDLEAGGDRWTRDWSGYVYNYNGDRLNYGGDQSQTVGEATFTGHYSDGEVGSCSGNEGEGDNPDIPGDQSVPNTCSCTPGSDGEDIDTESLIEDAIEDLEEALNNLNQIILDYNNCSGAVSNEALRQFTSTMENVDINPNSSDTTSWTNDMRFDPVVTFNYNQDYMNQMSGTFEQTSVSGPSASTTMYCDGSVNAQYGCTGISSSSISGSLLGTTPATVCTVNGGCQKMDINISNADYVQKSKVASATYAPNNEFSTYTQYGTIKFKHDACSGNDCLWSNLPEDALPVSLITQTGVFPFVINYSNIGQSNTTGALGRLAGNTTSVLTEYNELDPSVRCTTTDDYLKQDAGYVCHYLTNCNGKDHCDFTCDDDNNCEFTDKECTDDHCIMTCDNCIFDGESNNFSYRTITLNNLNPNERELGFNWSNVKGQATQAAIEDAGETVYETPQYSYTLTPTNLSNIREYNNQAGSYTNAYIPDEYAARVGNTALYCEMMDYNGVSDGLAYNCRSRFLDLIENSGTTFATESYRITSDSEEGIRAFESFNGCSSGYGNGECEYIGPSWRILTREVD